MTYKLFLDDVRTPDWFYTGNGWMVAKTCDDAIRIVNTYGCPEFISFDHDLGLMPGTLIPAPTGMDFAKWLVEQDLENNILPDNFTFSVHSANPTGASNIRNYLSNYMKNRKK